MLFKKMFFAVLLIVMSLPLAVAAQDKKIDVPLAVWSASQIDPTDHSVLYSVLMTSGKEALTDVTVSAQLPEGAAFVKDFWTPEAATFVGETDGVVTWTLAAVDADVVAGPFTFVASFENSASDDFAPPADFKANVTSSAGTVENEVTDNTLAELTDSGRLEITPEGMIDFAAVEETGLWVYAPQDAVADPVTLSFQRNLISKDAQDLLPKVAEETWWCGSVTVSADADVSFAQPMILVVPLLRAATPGTIMPVFAKTGDSEWSLISDESSLTSLYSEAALSGTAFAKVAPSGTEAYIVLNEAKFGVDGVTLAVGINTNVRTASVNSIMVIAVNNPPINPVASPWQEGAWF